MDLEQAQELFSAYREGELPPDQVRALEEKLARDETAREEYERFCRAMDSLALLKSVEPAPEDFVEKLQRRMKRRSGGRLFGVNRWGQVSRVPYELISLVLILIILSLYLVALPVVEVHHPSGPASGDEPSPPGDTSAP